MRYKVERGNNSIYSISENIGNQLNSYVNQLDNLLDSVFSYFNEKHKGSEEIIQQAKEIVSEIVKQENDEDSLYNLSKDKIDDLSTIFDSKFVKMSTNKEKLAIYITCNVILGEIQNVVSTLRQNYARGEDPSI